MNYFSPVFLQFVFRKLQILKTTFRILHSTTNYIVQNISFLSSLRHNVLLKFVYILFHNKTSNVNRTFFLLFHKTICKLYNLAMRCNNSFSLRNMKLWIHFQSLTRQQNLKHSRNVKSEHVQDRHKMVGKTDK